MPNIVRDRIEHASPANDSAHNRPFGTNLLAGHLQWPDCELPSACQRLICPDWRCSHNQGPAKLYYQGHLTGTVGRVLESQLHVTAM
jgi:hypothetical protein